MRTKAAPQRAFLAYNGPVKRLLPPLLLLPLAVGCGSAGSVPSAAQLLDAPTTLNVGGKLLSARVLPTVQEQVLAVRVRLSTGQKELPARLNLSGVYVVTNDGVWSSTVTAPLQWKCGPTCALSAARGPAGNVQPGQNVQVVLSLNDGQGHTFLLRSGPMRVGR